MPRWKPRNREFLITAAKIRIKKKDVSPRDFILLLDRIAKMDNLYDVDLVKPVQRPDKWATPPSSVPPEDEPEDLEKKKLLDEFYKKHYGGGDERATSDTTGTAGPAVQSSDPTGKPK